jgi:hypothetical protein
MAYQQRDAKLHVIMYLPRGDKFPAERFFRNVHSFSSLIAWLTHELFETEVWAVTSSRWEIGS